MSKILIFSMFMVCQLICCFSLSLITPFFPPFAEEKGISVQMVGVIFSANPVGAFMAALALGKIMTERNRVKFMLSALVLQSLGLYLFVVTNFIDEPNYIVTVAIIARLINGFATSLFMTPLYAYIPLLFPNSVQAKISIAEIFAAMGFLFGPVIGSLLHKLGGYNLPFMFFGSLALILVPIMAFQFRVLNKKLVQMEQLYKSSLLTRSMENNGVDLIPLNYSEVLQSYPVIMMSFCSFTAQFLFNFLNPIMAIFFQNTYGATADDIGFFLSVMPLTYVVSAIAIIFIKFNQRLMIFIGASMIGIASFFLGPDEAVTHIQHNIYISLTSMGVIGLFVAYLIVYSVPVLSLYLNARYPKQPNQCANMAAALFTAGNYLGELCGPLLSGFLNEQYGFERAVSIMGAIIIVFAIMFLPVIFLHPKKLVLIEYMIEESILHTSEKLEY